VSAYTITTLTADGPVRAFLMTDPDYAAYALGDLEPPYAEHATWHAACRGEEIEGLALVYTALDPTALFLMGSLPALEALLAHGVGPEHVQFICPPQGVPLVEACYRVSHRLDMLRMRITAEGFTPIPLAGDTPAPVRLGADSAGEVRALLELAAAHDNRALEDIAFDPEMIESGVYYGIRQDGALVASAGTHLLAAAARMAALGNVVVHPAYRGRGLAKLVSQAVVQALFNAGMQTVVLNVAQDNVPAIRVYERLGFRAVAEFIEGLAVRR